MVCMPVADNYMPEMRKVEAHKMRIVDRGGTVARIKQYRQPVYLQQYAQTPFSK
jgi:hypothetical protein